MPQDSRRGGTLRERLVPSSAATCKIGTFLPVVGRHPTRLPLRATCESESCHRPWWHHCIRQDCCRHHKMNTAPTSLAHLFRQLTVGVYVIGVAFGDRH